MWLSNLIIVKDINYEDTIFPLLSIDIIIIIDRSNNLRFIETESFELGTVEI